MNGSFANWPAWRKGCAAVFVLLLLAGLLVLANYGAAALFLALNRMDPRRVVFESLWTYWHWYGGDPVLRKKLIVSMAVSGGGFLVALPASLVMAARSTRPLHGAARFATPAEVRRAGLLGSCGPGIVVGQYRGRYLTLPGQLSVMLSAPTRSGKGVGVVVPNLLSWPDSVVVLDIKGENHALTAGFRAACGQKVFAFSPFDTQARSHRWNPLTSMRTSRLHRVGDLLAIGQVFFPNDGGGTSSEGFFNDQARNLFLGIGLYLLETPALPRTLGEMLRQSSGKGRSLKDHFTEVIRDRRQGEAGPTGLPPLSDECADALQRLLSNSDNTLSSIVATFNAPLTIWADAIVDAATSADDFRLEDVRRQRMSVYVRIPPNRILSARPLLNLLFSQLVSLNTQALPSEDPELRFQCLLVNDEFTAMGRVGVIATSAAFLAGYNLRLLTVVQAMSQLDAVYGDKEARTFATNHGLQILYAPREQRDAEEYSAMLGHFTEVAVSRGRSRSYSQHGSHSVSHNESDQRRALLLPQEFKELGAERLIVVMENCRPILADKIRYHRDPLLSTRIRPAPTVPRMAMEIHQAKTQQRWRYAPDTIPNDERLQVEALAHDFSALDEQALSKPPVDVAETLLNFFAQGPAPDSRPTPQSVAGAADEDGVIEDADIAQIRQGEREPPLHAT